MAKIKLREVELFYEMDGNAGEALVFLNGIGMSTILWQPIADHFLSRYRCLRHDFRGQMLSDKPEGSYSMEMHVEDTLALLDALGMDKVHLVGTSYGSEVALTFALTHPHRVRSLTVITGVSESDALLRAAVEAWSAAARSGDGLTFYKSLLPWTYSTAYLQKNSAAIAARASEFANIPRDFLQAFARLVDAFLRLDCTDRLKEIRCPTLIVAAEKDLIKPPRYSEIMHREIAHSEYHVVPDSGHAVVVEDPASINRLLDDFLRRNGGQ
jgi:3-oxoadipate enol-lactonase